MPNSVKASLQSVVGFSFKAFTNLILWCAKNTFVQKMYVNVLLLHISFYVWAYINKYAVYINTTNFGNWWQICISVCFSLTFEAENSKSFSRFWVTGLVCILVECADPEQASSALRPGDGDRVADAAIRHPAVVTAVQPCPPGRVQLTRRGQHRVMLLTLLSCLLQSDLDAERRRMEDLTCRQRDESIKWDTHIDVTNPLIRLTYVMLCLYHSVYLQSSRHRISQRGHGCRMFSLLVCSTDLLYIQGGAQWLGI